MGRKSRRKKVREKRRSAAAEPSPVIPRDDAEPSQPTHRSHLVACLVILVLCAVAGYANSLRAPFVLDDSTRIVEEPSIRPPLSLSKILATSRPAVTASFALNYALGELDVVGYHVVNLIAHLACGIVLFGFARYTLLLPVFRARYQGAANHLALLAACVFLVHPVQTESVTYVWQRAEIFVSVSLLASLWLAARLARSSSRWYAWPGLIAIGIFGILSKEIFGIALVLFALYDWCFIAEGRLEHVKRRWPVYLILALLAVTVTVRGIAVNAQYETMIGFGIEGIDPWRYLTWQFGVVLYYLRLVLVPDSLCFDCGFLGPWPVVHSWLGEMVLLPALLLAGMGAGAWLARKRYPLATFCVWGSAAVLAPTSSIVPLADVYVEHRMYLPIALLSLLFVVVVFDVSNLAVQRRLVSSGAARVARYVGAVVLCVVLTGVTAARNHVYVDSLRLWQDTVAKAPENYRAQFKLAEIYRKQGEYERAIEHYEEAIRRGLRLSGAYLNLGALYMGVGRASEAAATLESARELAPGSSFLHLNLARIYSSLGKKSKALAAAERAVALAPFSLGGRKLLGQAYEAAGRAEDALAEYQAAAKMAPGDAELSQRIQALQRRR